MANAILTRHAEIRFRQRGIRKEVLDCLEKHGETRDESCGATRIFLSKRNARRAVKDLKKVIRVIEHGSGVTLMADGSVVITGYRKK